MTYELKCFEMVRKMEQRRNVAVMGRLKKTSVMNGQDKIKNGTSVIRGSTSSNNRQNLKYHETELKIK